MPAKDGEAALKLRTGEAPETPGLGVGRGRELSAEPKDPFQSVGVETMAAYGWSLDPRRLSCCGEKKHHSRKGGKWLLSISLPPFLLPFTFFGQSSFWPKPAASQLSWEPGKGSLQTCSYQFPPWVTGQPWISRNVVWIQTRNWRISLLFSLFSFSLAIISTRLPSPGNELLWQV